MHSIEHVHDTCVANILPELRIAVLECCERAPIAHCQRIILTAGKVDVVAVSNPVYLQRHIGATGDCCAITLPAKSLAASLMTGFAGLCVPLIAAGVIPPTKK